MPRIKKSSSKRVSFKGVKKPVKKFDRLAAHASYVSRKSSSKKHYKKVSSKKKKKKITKVVRPSKGILVHPDKAISGAMKGYQLGASMHPYLGPVGAIGGGVLGLITGHGAYDVKSNSLAIPGTQIPSFDYSGRACTRVKHREYCFDVTGSTSAFVNTTYSINPGNGTIFPWLSGVAESFEEYRIEGMIFELRSISGTSIGATSVPLGFQGLSCDYNSAYPDFTSKLQFDNAEFAASGPPSANVLMPIECARRETVLSELYVNTGGIPSGQDARLFNLGKLQVCVGNNPGAYVLSELWVSYDVCFYKPKLSQSTGTDVSTSHSVATTGITTSNYFGSNSSTKITSSFAPTLTATTVTLPANIPLGNYVLYYTVTGSITAAVVGPAFSATSNCSVLNILFNNTLSQLDSISATSANAISTLFFTVTGPSPVLTVAGGTFPTAPTYMDLIISQISSTIT